MTTMTMVVSDGSTIAAAKDDSIGLNLVCEDAFSNNGNEPRLRQQQQQQQQQRRKPKKKNKYEKRREKARRAKEQQHSKQPLALSQSQSQSQPQPTSLHSKTPHQEQEQEHVIKNDGDISISPPAVIEEDDEEETIRHLPLQQEEKSNIRSDIKHNTNENNNDIINESSPSQITTKSHTDDTKLKNAHTSPSISTSTSTSTPVVSTSRKTQQAQAAQDLRDEAKRAEYMSTFHARPHEMDRRSGAVSVIRSSRESTHIFGDDDWKDDDDDENTISIQDGVMMGMEGDGDAKETREEEAVTVAATGTVDGVQCPFRACGLHPRLVRTITGSRMNRDGSTNGGGSDNGSNGLRRPTIVQKHAWKQLLEQEANVFVQSETGSGKTLAYLLPILQLLAVDTKTSLPKKVDRTIGGTRAIILCPTRELATQTSTLAESLCRNSFSWLVAGCLSGGEKRKSEKARLRKGISILIATPGRLLDHLDKTECLSLALKGKLEWIVLDESDRLMDMGLGSQVEQIVQMLRSNQPRSGTKRDGITWRSVLVSATVTDKVRGLAQALLGGQTWVWARGSHTNHASLSNHPPPNDTTHTSTNTSTQKENLELASATPRQLTQLYMVVSAKLRLAALIAFLTARVQKNERTVVFMSTCDGVDFHHKLFTSVNSILSTTNNNNNNNNHEEFASTTIFGKQCSLHRLHGNIPHAERQTILAQFSKFTSETDKKASVLIATDVAARGLNLPAVDWIVQYDPPCETADYVHRAGRAARAGRGGHALLFLLPSEQQYVEVLQIRGLKDMTALSLASTLHTAAGICSDLTAEGTERSGGGRVLPRAGTSDRSGEAFTSQLQIRLEDCIMEDDKAYKEALAKKVISSTNDKQQKKREKKQAKHAVGPLLASARNAFFAYIRSYPAKEKPVRHIFSPRALHLGHVARSFALKEAPKDVAKANRTGRPGLERSDEEGILKSTGKKRNSRLAFGGKGTTAARSTAGDGKDTDESMPGEDGSSTLTPKKQDKKKRQKMTSKSTSRTGKAEKTVSFLDSSDSFYSIQHIDDTQKVPSFANVQAKMLAAAKKMQGNSMEFF